MLVEKEKALIQEIDEVRGLLSNSAQVKQLENIIM
jgi:hypothetical protein